MTVKEFLEIKYREKMLTITEREYRRLKEYCQLTKKHPAEVVYMAFEITENDINQNGGWNGELYKDLSQMHQQKLVASNKHRQEHGHIDRYWLTKKGFKHLNVI